MQKHQLETTSSRTGLTFYIPIVLLLCSFVHGLLYFSEVPAFDALVGLMMLFDEAVHGPLDFLFAVLYVVIAPPVLGLLNMVSSAGLALLYYIKHRSFHRLAMYCFLGAATLYPTARIIMNFAGGDSFIRTYFLLAILAALVFTTFAYNSVAYARVFRADREQDKQRDSHGND